MCAGLRPSMGCPYSETCMPGVLCLLLVCMCHSILNGQVHGQIFLLNVISGREGTGGFGTHTIKGRKLPAEKSGVPVSAISL